MTARIFQFCSKYGEYAITVRSFSLISVRTVRSLSNLIDFEVTFLPESFMSTCNG